MVRIAVALLMGWMVLVQPAQAQEAVVIATVNDKPVTSFDVVQRAALLKALGDTRPVLPKVLANDILPRLASGDTRGLDASTAGLLRRLRTDR